MILLCMQLDEVPMNLASSLGLPSCVVLFAFAEGGRSRSGKVGLPKAGLLSVIVDAVMEGENYKPCVLF